MKVSGHLKEATRIAIGCSIFMSVVIAAVFCVDPTRYDTAGQSAAFTLIFPMVALSAIGSALLADHIQRRK